MLILRTALAALTLLCLLLLPFVIAAAAQDGAVPVAVAVENWRQSWDALVNAPIAFALLTLFVGGGLALFLAAVMRPEPGDYWSDPESWGDQ